MSSRIGGTIATFLMSIPISAAGLMAVFGTPQGVSGSYFKDLARKWLDQQPAAAGTDEFLDEFEDAPDFLNEDEGDSVTALTGTTPADSSVNDSADTSEADVDFEKPGSQSPRQPSSDNVASVGDPREKPLLNLTQEPDSPGHQPQPANRATRAGSSSHGLDEVTHKLEEMGITDYHIERGSSAATWLFVCTLTPPGDAPTVVRRFEAEAADPVLAARDTIAQVDQWLLARYRGRGE